MWPQLRQVMRTRPWPVGTRNCWSHRGHPKMWLTIGAAAGMVFVGCHESRTGRIKSLMPPMNVIRPPVQNRVSLSLSVEVNRGFNDTEPLNTRAYANDPPNALR